MLVVLKQGLVNDISQRAMTRGKEKGEERRGLKRFAEHSDRRKKDCCASKRFNVMESILHIIAINHPQCTHLYLCGHFEPDINRHWEQ